MPYTLKPNKLFVKDPDGGGFLAQNVIAEQTTEEMVAEIQTEGTAIKNNIVNQLNQAISDSQTAIDTLETQKDNIVEAVASMAELGTDTSLSVAGMAADAKATGDAVNDLKSVVISVNEESAEYTVIDGSYVHAASRYIAQASGYHRTAPILVGETFNKVRVGYSYSNPYVETLYFSSRTDIPKEVATDIITSVTAGTEYDIPEGTKAIFLSASSDTNFGALTLLSVKTVSDDIGEIKEQIETCVRVEPCEFTDGEKAQARANIGVPDFTQRKSNNLLNYNEAVHGSWWNSNGQLKQNAYTGLYNACKAKVAGLSVVSLYVEFNAPSYRKIYSYIFVDSSGAKIGNAIIVDQQTSTTPYTLNNISVPSGADEIRINIQYGSSADTRVALYASATATEYEEYYDYLYSSNLVPQISLDNAEKIEELKSGPDISLPDQYDAVVGDKLELFYSGIVNCKKPDDYYVELACTQAKGKAYGKQWEYTPVSGDTNFDMNVLLYNNEGKKLSEKGTKINVVAKPSTVSAMNVCCVGDSLTQAGVWCTELNRRLTGSSGTPAGDEYSNISFVGTMGTETKYEGRGGWTWDSYCSSGVVMYWVDVVSGQKTDAMHESIWSDGANQWTLETIEEGRLKFKRTNASGTYVMASSGTLTYVSGGRSETGNITYNNATAESGNPFWNTSTNKLDFAAYCSRLGISKIDVMVILLGWNTVLNGGVDANITNGKTFVDALHTDYPNCKVIICGLQVPSLDGWAYNYGTYRAGQWIKTYLTIKNAMFALNDAYQAWCDEDDYMAFMNFVQLSGQFDMDHAYPETTVPVNQRSTETMTVQTNCVHPSNVGQYMIADAVYRKMIALLAGS